MKSNVEINKGLVLKGTSSGLIARIINVGLVVWFNQFLIRRISAEEYSIYPLVLAIMSLLLIIQIAVDNCNSRYITAEYAKGNLDEVKRISSTMIIYNLIICLFLIVIGIFLCWKIDKILTINPLYINSIRIMIAIAMLSLIVNLIISPLKAGIVAKQKYIESNIIEVFVEVFRLIFLCILLFFVSTRVIWIVVATESAKLLGNLACMMISIRSIPALTFSISSVEIKRGYQLLTFGGWTFIGEVANRIRISINPIILNNLATPFDVTSFHIGTLFPRQIHRARIIATNSIFPSLVAMYETRQKERLKNTFLKFGRITIWTYMLIALPLIIYSSDFIKLYIGNQYLRAGPVIILVLINEIPYLGLSMIDELSRALARVKSLTIRSIIILIFNLSITIYLVGFLKMGAIGAALGTLISGAFIRTAIMIPMGLQLTGLDLPTWLNKTVIPGFFPCLPGASIWILLKLLHAPDTWIKLILYGLAGAVVYFIFLIKFSLQPDDRKDLNRIRSYLSSRK
ncbi:MAG: hypothetical protein JEY91_02425 [Spirochaetaceae bacterium]|nr:hypothetical protein [Spirochaetaceae bacterium]